MGIGPTGSDQPARKSPSQAGIIIAPYIPVSRKKSRKGKVRSTGGLEYGRVMKQFP